MIKAFLSHSSSDKGRYVRIVAEKLGTNIAVYDEYTFEAGMQPLEEIIKGLDESQIFVIFISDKALTSEWVIKELKIAYERLSTNMLQRIFPIIIDPNITYKDPRIPEWLKNDYNLKYVSRPVVSARRIKQRLREISWLKNPRLKERDLIFVGRNDLINQIEIRIDNLDQPQPICLIASGLPRIGRASLLRKAIVKCNVAKQSYEFPSIYLHREDSLEDFLLRLYDLGFSNFEYPNNLMKLPLEERIDIAKNIVNDIQNAQEIIAINDDGCIINYAGIMQEWFDLLLKKTANRKITFLISSRYKIRPDQTRIKPYIFSLSVAELNFQERNGLFKRLMDFYNLAISKDDFGFFSGLLHGFPDQVQFTCDLITENGIHGARRNSHEIVAFNSDKAATILSKYSNSDHLDFLYLISEFEFISLDFLFSVVDQEEYSKILEQMISESICDYVGIEREFIRLNDVIRDFVRRNRLEIPKKFQKKLKDHLNDFINDPNTQDRDISDIQYSMKEGVKANMAVPDIYLIPSHFLNSMRELYQKRGHLDRVIELADLLLAKKHLLDKVVEQDIRYYLCLSLARKKNDRLLKEVQEINGPEHSFLLGFYYRLQGRAKDSIDRLEQCISEPSVANRAKRELVQVYISIEDYESASKLAEENYENNQRNPYHIQAYFNTIVNSKNASSQREILNRLIVELISIGSDISLQMADIAKADFLAKCDHNYNAAIDIIEDTINKYPEVHYPLIAKAFLAARNNDLNKLKSAYEKLDQLSKKISVQEETLTKIKAYILAIEGHLNKAILLAKNGLKRLPDNAQQSFIRKLTEIHNH